MGHGPIAEGTAYKHVPTGDKWVVTHVLQDNRFHVENQTAGGKQTVSLMDLAQALGREEIEVFGAYGANARVMFGEAAATAYVFADFDCVDAKYREEAWRIYEMLLPYLELPPHERRAAIEAEDKPICDAEGAIIRRKRGKIGTATSARTKRRMLSTFLKSGYDLRSLAPAVTHRKPGRKAIHEAAQEIDQEPNPVHTLLDAILSKQKLGLPTTIGAIRRDLLREVTNANKLRARDGQELLETPSAKTVGRYIRKKELEYILRIRRSRVAAHGDETAVMPGPRADTILGCIQLDQSPLDLVVVDEVDRLPIGRPVISTGIDEYSEYPFGLYVGFESYSYQGIRYGLLDGMIAEQQPLVYDEVEYHRLSCGNPRMVKVDKSKAYTGNNLTEAARMLGMIVDECTVKSPWEKGDIERFIRTNQDFVHTLRGTTFSTLMQLRVSDYDPMKDACIPLSSFRKLMHIFLYGIYARRPHRGLNRRAPEAVWKEGWQAHPPDFPHSARDVRLWLCSSAARTIQSTGIEIHCLRYQSPKLTPLRKSQTEGMLFALKYDESDLSHIYVLDPTKPEPRQRGSWVKVPAVDQEYTRGLSLYQHNVILDYAKRTAQKDEVDEYDLAVAEHHIRKIVEDEFRITGQARRTRVTAARLLGRDKDARVFKGVDLPGSVDGDIEMSHDIVSLQLSRMPSVTDGEQRLDLTTDDDAETSAIDPKSARRERVPSVDQSGASEEPIADGTIYRSPREGWDGDHGLPRPIGPT